MVGGRDKMLEAGFDGYIAKPFVQDVESSLRFASCGLGRVGGRRRRGIDAAGWTQGSP